MLGGIDKVIPVDVYVPGCCPRPEAIIDGIVMAVGKLDEKAELMKQREKNGEADNASHSGNVQENADSTPEGGKV